MRFVLFSIVALSFVSVSWAQQKSKKEVEWREYVSQSMNWKSIFPGKPREVTRKTRTKAGDLQINTVSYEARDAIFAVVTTKFPDSIDEADPQKLIAAARDALTANGGKLVLDEKIVVTGPHDSKCEGRDVTVEFGKHRIRTRLFYERSRLFQISVTGPEKAVSTETARKFMTAFELTNE